MGLLLPIALRTFQFGLGFLKNCAYFTQKPMYIYARISLNSSQNEKCSRQKLYRRSKHTSRLIFIRKSFGLRVNPLKPELNPICYLLAFLGAHHFLHVSRIRVKLLTFRRLMSHIYGAPILDVSRSHTTTQHSR